MLDHNLWLKNCFPQIFQRGPIIKNDIILKYDKKHLPKIIENASRKIMYTFLLNGQRKRMEHVEKVKHPYGLFDVPERK